jgi:thioredoxin 2
MTRFCPKTVSRKIRAAATLAIFKGGKEIARTSGAVDESGLIAWIRSHV